VTTFALGAGMFPVATGWGEGADFRTPLGRAVIAGDVRAFDHPGTELERVRQVEPSHPAPR
jgi:hypothetical protein